MATAGKGDGENPSSSSDAAKAGDDEEEVILNYIFFLFIILRATLHEQTFPRKTDKRSICSLFRTNAKRMCVRHTGRNCTCVLIERDEGFAKHKFFYS